MPPADRAVIDLELVSKTYRGRIHALQDVAMRVMAGEIFGLLGANGAGKSTLVKILMTVVRPTRCRGLLLDEPVGSKRVLARVGYLPEHHRFPDYLTAAQVLDYFGALADVPRARRRERARELLQLVGLGPWADHTVRTFSKGMRQRLGVAQALVNDPDLVLLDEPTDGVDPVGRRDIRVILQELRARGTTVFLNSHLLSELEMVCDRVAILAGGRVAAQGTIAELTAGEERFDLEFTIGDGLDGARRAREALEPVVAGPWILDSPPGTARARLPDGTPIDVGDGFVRLATGDAAPLQPVLDALRRAGATIRAVRPHRPSLEDLFLRAVRQPAGATRA